MDVVPLAREDILVGHVVGSQVGAVVVLVLSVVLLAELNLLLLSVRARVVPLAELQLRASVVLRCPLLLRRPDLNQLLLSVRARMEVENETVAQAVAVRLPALLRRTG